MNKRLLLECFNLALPSGTGIKTYARMLAGAASRIGLEVDALVQSPVRLNRRDRLLAEIAFFEGVARSNWKDKYLRQPAEMVFGKPFGLEMSKVPRSGVVLQSGMLAQGHEFREVWATHRLIASARAHFRRYGSLVRLRDVERHDIFHATHLIPLRVENTANIYTVHDVIPLRLPQSTLDNKKYFLNSLRAVCKSADRIITVSECSKKDILSIVDMPEDRIAVTYQAVTFPDAVLSRGPDDVHDIIANNFGLELGGYFLYFGALEPKKNVSRLIDAYAASGVTTPLIVVGGLGWNYETEAEQLKDERFASWRIMRDRVMLERRVRQLGHVSFEHLTALVQGARAVLFPSLYEGFGLPVLEAMTLGAPVMTSNVSSLPEVAGDAAILINPYDTEEMSRTIRTLDNDQPMREELSRRGRVRARRFSIENYRQSLQEVYRGVGA